MNADAYIPDPNVVFPRQGNNHTCYLKNVIESPNIIVGDFTIHHSFHDPRDFEKENVLYHYPVNNDRLIIGKFCSISNGVKFIMNGANHSLDSFTTFPFPLFSDDWGSRQEVTEAWDNKGDTVVGNDVWIGFETIVMPGVHIGDGAIVATRSLVNKDVAPYTIVGGSPAKAIRKRYEERVISLLLKAHWWDWDISKIQKSIPVLCGKDVEALEKLLAD